MNEKDKLEQYKHALLRRKETRKYICKKSFREFCRYYFQENFYYPFSDYHKKYAKSLEEWKNVLFIGHRESAKTTFARWYLVWLICYEKSPFILRSSYDQTKSKENIYYISQYLVENERIVQDFGHLYASDQTKTTKEWRKKIKTLSSFIAENGVLVRSISLKSSTRWLVHNFKGVNVRPMTVIFDDIDTELSVKNPKIIDGNYRFLKGEILWWLSANSQRIMLWNVINQDGLVPRLEKDYKDERDFYRVPTINHTHWSTVVNWKVRDHNIGKTNRDRFVQTEEEARVKNEIFQRETKLSMKPFVALDFLLKDLWLISFNQNHRLEPYIDGTTIVKDYMIKVVESMRPNEHTYTSTLWIDPAFSEKTNTDPIWLTITRKRWVGDVLVKFIVYSCELEGEDKELKNIKKKVRHLQETIWFDNIKIETNNGGGIIARELKQERYSVEEVTSSKDKVTRLREFETDFLNWNVYFKDGDDTKSLRDQLVAFPNVEHDDQVDSMVFSFGGDANIKAVKRDLQSIKEKYLWKRSSKWLHSPIGWKF